VLNHRYETDVTVITILYGFHGFHMPSGKKKKRLSCEIVETGALMLK
jgi:hypothetical protein